MNEIMQGIFIICSIFFILWINKEFLVDNKDQSILLQYKSKERINYGKKRRKNTAR